jgi:putative peptidoglycan lipid II flippase
LKLFRSAAVVSAMTLISRVLGFLRDVVLARMFGVSAATDAFYVALRIPNLMRRLFAEGSFSLAFVPVFNEYKQHHGSDGLRELVACTFGVLLAALMLIVGVGMLAAPGLVALFAPGFIDEPAKFELATDLLRVTFPYALFISLVAMAGGILNSFGRFGVPAFTPVFLNISLIAAALYAAPWFTQPIEALAWGVFVAGVVQLAFQLPSLLRLGMLPRPKFDFKHPGVRKIGALMLPTLFGSSVAQLNILIDTLIASLLVTGSISWLFYSDRLLEFPLGVFGIAISTVILPSLSRLHAEQDKDGFDRALDWGRKMGLLIAVPAAVGLGALAGPIVATLFNYGQFDLHDVQMTAASVLAYSAGLPAYVMIKVLAPAFFSRQDTRTPVRIAILALVTNTLLNFLFVWALLRWRFAPPHAGLAFASSLAAYLNAGLLYRALRREGLAAAGSGWTRHIIAVALGSLLMGVVVFWLAGDWARWIEMDPVARVTRLLLTIVTGMTAYGLVAWLLMAPLKELRDAPT